MSKPFKTLLEAFVYFVESGLPEKLAKELAEKLTGVKAPQGKIEIPTTKAPDEFRVPEAKQDVIEVSDDVSPGYAQGDTRYNADVLATALAERRGFIKEGQDSTDMDAKKYSELYSEAYSYLTNLRKLNQPVERVSAPKKLATRKQRGDLTFVNTKISDPQKSKFVLQGLDGTTESIYSQFRLEQEAIKKGMIKDLNFIKENNIALSAKDKDNIKYNIKIFNDLSKKTNILGEELVGAGKDPQKIFEDFRKIKTAPFQSKLGKVTKQMDESMKKIQKLLDEMEDIRSGKAERDRKAIINRQYQGKGYGDDQPLYRTLARQFLKDEIEAGRIETSQEIYNAMKTGAHPFIDAIKIFRHHYGDDAFDILGKYIDNNYPAFDSPGLRYPGRFEFRKLGIVPKNKKAPGNTYDHYNLPDEIDAQIEEIDNLISDYELGKSPMIRSKEELLDAIREQNNKRGMLVKIRNEIAPQDAQKLEGDELLESAEVIDFPDDTNFAQGGIVSLT